MQVIDFLEKINTRVNNIGNYVKLINNDAETVPFETYQRLQQTAQQNTAV